MNSTFSILGTLRNGKVPILNDSVTEMSTQYLHWQVKEMFTIAILLLCIIFDIVGWDTLFCIFNFLCMGDTSETQVFHCCIILHLFMADDFLYIYHSPCLLQLYQSQVMFFLLETLLFLQVSVL